MLKLFNLGEIFENIIVNIFYWIRCMTGEFTSGFRDSLKVSKNYYHNCIFNLLYPSLSSQKLVKPCWTCKTSFRVLISVKLSWERERERERKETRELGQLSLIITILCLQVVIIFTNLNSAMFLQSENVFPLNIEFGQFATFCTF